MVRSMLVVHRGIAIGSLSALALQIASPGAIAQGFADYPSRPVSIIVPFEGNGIDQDLRVFVQTMNLPAGGTFVFEAKAGAAGAIGTGYVAKARPDGYTLLASNTSFTITAGIYPNLPYDVTRDFAPVSLLMQKAYLLLTNGQTPFRTAGDYLDYARAHPDELNFSTGGLGGSTHLPGAMLHYLSNTRVTFVHYKSASQRLIDLVAGRTQAAVGTVATTAAQVKAGKMRALGVTTSRRISIAPDLPSLGETVAGFDYSSWTGLLAPAKTPPALVARLHQLWTGALRQPAVTKKLDVDGTIVVGSSPDEFQKFIVADQARWRKLAQDTGLKPESE